MLSRFLGRLESAALGDRLLESEVLHLKQLLNYFPILKSFNNLVSDCFLEAVIVTKVAGFSEFAKTYKIIVECLTDVLSSLTEVASFNGFIDLSVDIGLQGCDGLSLIFLLSGRQS